MRLIHYSDVENAYDRPERIGRLAGCIAADRDDETLVVGTGDVLGPGVLAMAEDGRQSLDFFGAVDPDVGTFGNHDFDFGHDALREVVRESPQTWVSANVEDGGEPFAGASPATVVERGGESVGLVGVSDPASSIPDELTVSDPVAAVDGATDTLHDADWTVALAHLRDDRLDDLATETDVDAILAGHVHGERCDRVDGTLVVRPGANGRVVWNVELGRMPDGTEAVDATRRAVADAPCDGAVADRLRARLADAGLAEVVATADRPLDRNRADCFAGERRITNFVTDAYRWATDADVGFVDTRMLRDGPPIAGEVTVADVRGLAPFEADLCPVELPGAALRDLAEQAVVTDERARRTPTDEALWAHVSGMRVAWDRDERALREVRVGDEPLDDGAEYALATTEYVVETDEFPAASPDHVIDRWGVQYDALVEYAREVGVAPELDGRIEVV